MIGLAIAAAAAIAQPRVVARVPADHRIVEGIATDRQTIWVSSVLDRQILACTATCRTIATLPQGLHPLGIAWDWSRDLLWVAADCPGLPGVPKCRQGALLALAPSGKIVARLAPGADFHPGDVSVSLRAVFVSDSRNGRVYGLLPRRRELRAINPASDGKSAQGTAMAPDGAHVIVADYARGIGRIDMKSGATAWLPSADGKPLRGIDGLVRCGERYFGIYNGGVPGRLVSLRVGERSVEVGTGLALPDPTQIAFDGKRLFLIANAGWETATNRDGRRTEATRIVELPLPAGCGG